MGNYTSKSVILHFHKSIDEKVFIFEDAVVDFNGKCIKSNLYTVCINYSNVHVFSIQTRQV